MKKFILIALLAILVAISSGCASISMKKSLSQTIAPPSSGMATVVFMRTSFIASAIGVELFDVTDGKIVPVGSLSNGTKVAYEVLPGEKVFMTYGTAADFMRANLVAGKTYYTIVRPNWGTGGFAPTPIRADGTSKYNTGTSDFKSWKSGTDLVEPEGNMATWFDKGKQQEMQDIYNTYWAIWQNKNDSQKNERTLRIEDGL